MKKKVKQKDLDKALIEIGFASDTGKAKPKKKRKVKKKIKKKEKVLSNKEVETLMQKHGGVTWRFREIAYFIGIPTGIWALVLLVLRSGLNIDE